ncbi:MAG: LacI family DNA-binding transcriptional regulator [Candidatus Aerophobetes bacterium]|nr:LacI family DNA-binding transcriptional regulator [Candidatus Aerophobetes bacterium]
MAITIKDIARVAGVSIATVSTALNDRSGVGADTKLRVLAVAEKLGYEPNILARSLVTKKTHTIGLIISDISNPFFTRVVRGIEDVANENGFNLILCNTDEEGQKEKAYLRILQGKQVDGLIIISTEKNSNHIKSLVENNIPLVLLDRKLEGLQVDSVVVDNVEGSRKATSHLIKLGHRKIGIIHGPETIMTGRDRLEGYKRALREHNLPLESKYIKEGNFKQEGGYSRTLELLELKNPPSALFVTNNLMTMGAFKALKEERIRVPEEIALIGFDDMEWASLASPPLTAVSQPTYRLGTSAANLLLSRIKAPAPQEVQEVVLEPKLVIRESCGEKR